MKPDPFAHRREANEPWVCMECRDTGVVGDNGPGVAGNREYVTCDCQRAPGEGSRGDAETRSGATAMNNAREIIATQMKEAEGRLRRLKQTLAGLERSIIAAEAQVEQVKMIAQAFATGEVPNP